jgi:hypothetical protein
LAIVLRILVIFAALIAALAAAGNVYMVVDYWPHFDLMAQYGLPHGSLAPVLVTIIEIAASLAFVLFLLVIALAERYALRSPVFYAAAGLALLVLLRFDFSSRFPTQNYALYGRGGLTLLATGLALGLVYWVIAGRKAGKWLEK